MIVWIAARVLDQVTAEVRAHPGTETGLSLVGLELQDPVSKTPIAIVLGTLPDVEDAVRTWGSFTEGGESQVRLFDWWTAQWEAYRAKSKGNGSWLPGQTLLPGLLPSTFDTPLSFIGGAHKHPGQGMSHPSGTDLNTAREIVYDPVGPRPFFLVAIATMGEQETANRWRQEGNVILSQHAIVDQEISWWALRAGQNTFEEATPFILQDAYLPWLPPLPWYLLEPVRRNQELSKLASYTVKVSYQQMDSDVELEVLFAIDHPSWKRGKLILVTQVDYPKTPVQILVIPKAVGSGEPVPQGTVPVPIPPVLPQSQGFWEWLRKAWRSFWALPTEEAQPVSVPVSVPPNASPTVNSLPVSPPPAEVPLPQSRTVQVKSLIEAIRLVEGGLK